MTRDRRLHIPYSFSVVLINARLTFPPRRKKCVNRAGTLHTTGFFPPIEILKFYKEDEKTSVDLKSRFKNLLTINWINVYLLLFRIRRTKTNKQKKIEI